MLYYHQNTTLHRQPSGSNWWTRVTSGWTSTKLVDCRQTRWWLPRMVYTSVGRIIKAPWHQVASAIISARSRGAAKPMRNASSKYCAVRMWTGWNLGRVACLCMLCPPVRPRTVSLYLSAGCYTRAFTTSERYNRITRCATYHWTVRKCPIWSMKL